MSIHNSRRSSTEEDYREIVEATIHDQLRDGIAQYAKNQKSKKHRRHVHDGAQDTDLTRVVTRFSSDLGFAPENLSDIDPRLDPQSEAFDFRFWATIFLQLLREDGFKRTSVGVSFSSLTVSGTGAGVELQRTIASPFKIFASPSKLFQKKQKVHTTILNNFNGVVKRGEMLLVLGRPGSGCTTFLKSITGHLEGLSKAPESSITYDGIGQDVFAKFFPGRAVYNQESDEHMPHLTVGQTLHFAASAATSRTRIQGVTRQVQANHMADVMMRIFGLSHVHDTKVGNDTIRGVSGGERKRVSIAEMALARSSIATWDNSTRGLDAATALEFARSLRTLADVMGVTQAMAIYQASQSIYDLFDKVLVLYEGRQIYFGPVSTASAFFHSMGWQCPPRQTTPDFLTSVTNPSERIPREGYENKVPRTALDFEKYWFSSDEYKTCMAELSEDKETFDGRDPLNEVREVHRQHQAKHARKSSPYLLSVPMQIKLCMKRCSQLLWNDRKSTIVLAIGRVILGLIIGSIYYGPADTTGSLSSRGSVIFLATLLNALMAVTEIGSLFGKRNVVRRQKEYAFYHPFADAFAAFLVDIPPKFVISTMFNLVFYFLSGLRPEPGPFFVFLLFSFLCMLTMSAIFRTVGSGCRQLSLAYAVAGLGVLIMVIYTGFTLQTTYMHPWFRWINYINPISYVFSALLVNEVHAIMYPCAPQSIIPPYSNGVSNFACASIGAVPDQLDVSGDQWVNSGYGYSYSDIWRNLGIIIAYMVAFLVLHLAVVEFKSTTTTSPQRLIFRNRKAAESVIKSEHDVESNASQRSNNFIAAEVTVEDKLELSTSVVEGQQPTATMQKQKTKGHPVNGSLLTWEDVTLDIDIRGTQRRLLNNVSGWVKSGTMTCLMGVSGAGKTTLLDTLAQRQNAVGQLSGTIHVDGLPLKSSFQRKTGYVQQQDLHLPTSTVREALRFSALLRQSASISREEKYAYVEKVIEMLNMECFSEAIVGQPGEGLNIEQRKLLTIGIELASKPKILFLDEPTSGLDSQSSWTIVTLLRKLAANGQAILATIHQPSAMLFQEFDSILLLGKGGRTAYFGPLGPDCHTLTNYFEAGGARTCDEKENPAEYILGVIGNTSVDWPGAWTSSGHFQHMKEDLSVLANDHSTAQTDPDDGLEFAASFTTQFKLVLKRLFQNYSRNPDYISAKVKAGTFSALFIGFSFFLQNSSLTGLQNALFSIFMLNATFSTTVNQVSPSSLIPVSQLTVLGDVELPPTTLTFRSSRGSFENVQLGGVPIGQYHC